MERDDGGEQIGVSKDLVSGQRELVQDGQKGSVCGRHQEWCVAFRDI